MALLLSARLGAQEQDAHAEDLPGLFVMSGCLLLFLSTEAPASMRNALIVIGFALILVPAVTLFTKRFETEMIETGEREELCELIDEITRSGSLDPEDYAGGDGLASEWREW